MHTPSPHPHGTMHKDINRDVSRSQDRDPLHRAIWICPLKVTAGHTDTHTVAGFAWPPQRPARVRNWAKGPGKAGQTRMWWTRGLTREGWGRPTEKDRGCRLNSWAPRPHLASPSWRRAEARDGCSGQEGGREERALRQPEGRLAAVAEGRGEVRGAPRSESRGGGG